MKGEFTVSKSYLSDAYKREMTEKYFDMVFRLALMRTKDKYFAEDVCQDVFFKYLKSNKEFETEEHIKAWLIRVTINASKSLLTSSWHKKTVALTEDIAFSSPEKSDLFDQVKKLPVKYATIIHLHYYEDMSITQISKLLSMKESTVKSHLFRGRQKLKTLLGGRYDYEI